MSPGIPPQYLRDVVRGTLKLLGERQHGIRAGMLGMVRAYVQDVRLDELRLGILGPG